MKKTRQPKTLCRHWVAGLALASGLVGLAQAAFPEKPIQIIIAFPPGGATDVLARAVGQEISKQLGQSVIVENRPGAGGTIGAGAAARSPADGHTLHIASVANMAIVNATYPDQPVSLAASFDPIGAVAIAPHALVVPASSPAKDVPGLIQHLKSTSTLRNYASQGTGSLSHLESALFDLKNNLDLSHIPYKGSAQALPDLVSGREEMMFDSVVASLPMVSSGKLRYLAVASGQRTSLLPDIPTLKESGVDLEANNLFALFAPRGTAPDVLQTLETALQAALASPQLKTTLASQGVEVYPMPSAQLAQTVKQEYSDWAEVVKKIGLSPN